MGIAANELYLLDLSRNKRVMRQRECIRIVCGAQISLRSLLI